MGRTPVFEEEPANLLPIGIGREIPDFAPTSELRSSRVMPLPKGWQEKDLLRSCRESLLALHLAVES